MPPVPQGRSGSTFSTSSALMGAAIGVSAHLFSLLSNGLGSAQRPGRPHRVSALRAAFLWLPCSSPGLTRPCVASGPRLPAISPASYPDCLHSRPGGLLALPCLLQRLLLPVPDCALTPCSCCVLGNRVSGPGELCQPRPAGCLGSSEVALAAAALALGVFS